MKVLHACFIWLTTLCALGFAHEAEEKSAEEARMQLRRRQEQVVHDHKVLVQQLPFSTTPVSGPPPGEECNCPPCLSFSIMCYSDDLACPLVYAPVCGCDGVTYENECIAKTFNCVPCVTNGPCVTIGVNEFAVPGPPTPLSTKLPPLSVPQSLPLSVPEVPSLSVQIPSLSVPEVPSFSMQIPSLSVPTLSTFSVPSTSLPEVPSFSVQFPSISIPQSVPRSLPELSSYSVKIPPLSVPPVPPLSLPLAAYEIGSYPFQPPVPQCDCPLPIFGCCKIPPAICNPSNINCDNIPDILPLPPVCGCDGKTYANACDARFTNCVRCWTRGACPSNTGPTAKGKPAPAELAAPRETEELGNQLRRRHDQAVLDHKVLVQQLSFSVPSVSGPPPVPGPPTSFSTKLPPVSVPQSLSLSVPEVPSFSVQIPSLSVPELPSFSVQIPSLSVPTLSVPPVSLPALSTFSVPPLSVPGVPSFSVQIPSLSVPAVSLPGVPSFSVPGLSAPELSTFSAPFSAPQVSALSVQLSVKPSPVPPFSLPLAKEPPAKGGPGPKGKPAPA